MVAGGLIVLIGIAIVTLPYWLRPVVEARATAALGRPVTIDHLALGIRPVRVTLSGVKVAGSPAIPDPAYLATLDELALTLDLTPLWHGKMVTIPEVAVSALAVEAIQTSDGRNNFTFAAPGSGSGAKLPAIGELRITNSHAHLLMPEFSTDTHLAIHTEDQPHGRIIAEVTGTYHNQPITGRLTGAAVLSLRDASTPYSVDLKLANGDTHVSLAGTIQDPINLGGADLKLELAGQDMALLYPLIGVPMPPTTPYRLASAVTYADSVFHLTTIDWTLGNTDVTGALTIDPRPARPIISGTLVSKHVDMDDLAGFIGSEPGNSSTKGESPAQQRALQHAIDSPKLIPTVPMDLTKLRAADFHVTYRAASVIGKSVPFDTLSAKLDIVDGGITISDFRVGIGSGQILGEATLTPTKDTVHTVADIKLQKLDIQRMLAATHMIKGQGLLGGQAKIESTGKSLAEILGNGNGQVTLVVAGGNISAVAIDLSGLKLGSAALSALGFPDREDIRCLIGDLSLTDGTLQTRTLMLDTTNDRTTVEGKVDLKTEMINATLRTQAKHFTVGTLADPITMDGTLKSPGFHPEAGMLGGRAAAAVGLALLFPPAGLLATIQLGIGDDNACVALLKEAAAHAPKPK
jgi:uncharacterized protein involved in outer membrane biogenesis